MSMEDNRVRKLKPVDREQSVLRPIVVERLIPVDHKARAIWELSGELDLSGFLERIESLEGYRGRPATDPRVLLSVWVYGYSEGISSARELHREMSHEPGLQWLTGLSEINYHTLADFRATADEALKQTFSRMLASLDQAGVITLAQVMHDGTKIEAQAAGDSFRRERTIAQRLAEAEKVVERFAQEGEQESSRRRRAAQQRAAREQLERLQQAKKAMEQLQAKGGPETRVSISEPDARVMKHSEGGYAPSYNAQISTESTHKFIVGAHLSQCGSDFELLSPSVQQIEQNLGKKPRQMVVDGGYVSESNVEQAAAQHIDLIGSLGKEEGRERGALKSAGMDEQFGPKAFPAAEDGQSLHCPAGKPLWFRRQNQKHGLWYRVYRGERGICVGCPFQPQCCPRHVERGREVNVRVPSAEMQAFRNKMQTPEAMASYRKRSEIAEWPNLWIKDKLGLRKFRLRGLLKAGIELLWVCLTYNILNWKRLRCTPAAS
jgi:transposase